MRRPIGFDAIEISLRESFVDDSDFARVGDLGFVEEAAVAQLNLQNAEESLAAKLEQRGPFFGVNGAGDFDVGGKSAVGRKRAAFGDVGHAGKRFRTRARSGR